MFREICFDMVVNYNDKNFILFNYKSKEDINNYIKSLSEFYKIDQNNLNIDSINLENLNKGNDLLQIIPNKKEARFNRKKIYFITDRCLK